MKTKIVLLFLLGWVGMAFGQVKLLSDYKSKYPNLSRVKTSQELIKKIDDNKNKEKIIKLIKENTGVDINNIDTNSIGNGILKYK